MTNVLFLYSSLAEKSFKDINVTRSDKIGLIAEKYTCSYYGIYHLICRCYSNSVCFIRLLRIVCINSEVLIQKLCSEK